MKGNTGKITLKIKLSNKNTIKVKTSPETTLKWFLKKVLDKYPNMKDYGYVKFRYIPRNPYDHNTEYSKIWA